MSLDFQGLNQKLLLRIRTLLPEWLPGGRVKRNEYICGDLKGRPGQSCRINLDTGKWGDFSTEHRGLDLISLYAAINNISQKDSYIQLNELYGEAAFKPSAPSISPDRAMAQEEKVNPPKETFIPPPKGTPYPPWRQEPTSIWRYHNPSGDVLFLVTRTDKPDGKKTFCPWSWSSSGKWVPKQYPGKKPLYNLHKLTAEPNKPVLIVEGEKACDAAEKFAGKYYTVVTWCGGSSAVSKTDWSTINNRNVLIWPDADKPGEKAAFKIAEKLLSTNKEVKVILDEQNHTSGWDAADSDFTNC